MFSARVIYLLGISVSLVSIFVWIRILIAQIEQYKTVVMNTYIKKIMLLFVAISLSSNFVPIWFYIYRLSHNSNPTNIFYAFVINVYTYQATTAVMFYLLYKT